MAAVKIGTKHQVTIPKDIFEKLHLKAGEWVEAIEKAGKIILIPKQLTDKPAVPRLSKNEQKTLTEAKKKIDMINANPLESIGLNKEEIKVAVKVGLIEKDQAWWWHEDWQKGEREADKNIKEGKISKAYDDVEELIKDLNS